MPRVTVRLGEGLEELLRPPRHGPLAVLAPPGATVLSLVEDLGIPRTEIGGLEVNGRTVPPTLQPAEGDLVEVCAAAAEAGTAPPRFVLDVHLGRLARLLRLLGFDATWSRDAADAELASASDREGRILLSRDRGLLKRRQVRRGCLVRSQAPRRQLEQVVARYCLRGLLAPFSRCLICNVPISLAASRDTDGAPRTAGWCPACGRRYWRGSHREAMGRLVDEIKRGG